MLDIRSALDEVSYQIGDRIMMLPIVESSYIRTHCMFKLIDKMLKIIPLLVSMHKWHVPDMVYDHVCELSDLMHQAHFYKLADKKLPSQQQYYEWLFADHYEDEHDITVLCNCLISYHDYPVLDTDANIFKIIQRIMYEFSVDLANDQFENARKYICTPELLKIYQDKEILKYPD